MGYGQQLRHAVHALSCIVIGIGKSFHGQYQSRCAIMGYDKSTARPVAAAGRLPTSSLTGRGLKHAYQPVDRRKEPLSPAACPQPRGLVSLGARGVRKGAPGGQADLPLHWLLHLPLVPRDGARLFRPRPPGHGSPGGRGASKRAPGEANPIFLSIASSTCHWCHVMERESFENEPIAALMNRHFVAIKVDREERPDVDRIYMAFVQATTGGGGWPMSVWLTPELRPFYGGTYFPPEQRYGHPGFPMVLERVAEAWTQDRGRIEESSREAIEQLTKQSAVAPAGPGSALRLDKDTLDAGFYVFRRSFDSRYAGFGEAPKFPRPVALNFLLRYYARAKSQEALDMVAATLREMAKGGMYDHLGGGFHRYSVDARWFVPHFEKMLYDQAQLAVSYVEAFQITGDASYSQTARGILDFVLRDMRDPDGGFHSAEDAD